MKRIAIITTAALLAPTAAQGQMHIDSLHAFAWCENLGWTNWKGAGDGSDGVIVGPRFLSGYLWCENAGWINVGDGAPSDGRRYGNKDAADFGVNIQSDGTLKGLGWGENIGWVNFDTSDQGADRARFDACLRRFRGYAWSENAGWLNLDDSDSFVAVQLPDCAAIESLGVTCKRSGTLRVTLTTTLPEGSVMTVRDSADGLEFCMMINVRGRARLKRHDQTGDHEICVIECTRCQAASCR